jgi:lysophospholipid acyltransferase (LPLAT)-like uncharacterized protein
VKKLMNTRAGQIFLAYVLSFYIDFALFTMRWRFENRGPADAAVAAPEGLVACFWHGRITLAVVCRRVLRKKPRRVLISLSRDGEFIATAVNRLGFPAIRGSAGRGALSKGGAPAVMRAVRFMRDGGVLAVTPDGPRGPNQVMPDGPVHLARMAGVNTFVFGLATSPGIQLNSWDRTRLPTPFGRGCVVFDGPFPPPDPDADEAAIEATRAEWQERLNAAQAKAEAILASR